MENTLLEIMKDLLENNNVEKLDFTKKEDVEKLENAINKLRKNSIFSFFFEDEAFDNLLNRAKQIYNEAHKKQTPVKPSTKINDNIKKNCHKLASDYVESMIIPYIDKSLLNNDSKNEMIDALYEFACWIYKK